MNQDEFERDLSRMPLSWYPSALRAIASAGYSRGLWLPGGLSTFVTGLERQLGQTGENTKPGVPTSGSNDTEPLLMLARRNGRYVRPIAADLTDLRVEDFLSPTALMNNTSMVGRLPDLGEQRGRWLLVPRGSVMGTGDERAAQSLLAAGRCAVLPSSPEDSLWGESKAPWWEFAACFDRDNGYVKAPQRPRAGEPSPAEVDEQLDEWPENRGRLDVTAPLTLARGLHERLEAVCRPRRLLTELAEQYRIVPVDEDDWETEEQALAIAGDANIHIHRDKQLSLVALAGDEVVGAVWSATTHERGEAVYDFDVVVDRPHRSPVAGVGPALIDAALREYRDLAADMPAHVRVWVVNPKLARWLEAKRGFEPEDHRGWRQDCPYMIYRE